MGGNPVKLSANKTAIQFTKGWVNVELPEEDVNRVGSKGVPAGGRRVDEVDRLRAGSRDGRADADVRVHRARREADADAAPLGGRTCGGAPRAFRNS